MVSAFPFDRVPRIERASLARTNALARWLAVRPAGRTVATLVGGDVVVKLGGGRLTDPHAAACEVRVGGHAIIARGASGFVRWFAQKLLGGPPELNAPRALNEIEQAMWVLFVAATVEDLGIEGQVWQTDLATSPAVGPGSGSGSGSGSASASDVMVIEARIAGVPCTIELAFPAGLMVAPPPERTPAWAERAMLDLPIVVGRCWLDREDLGRLRPRSVVTLDRTAAQADLVVLDGLLGLRADLADPLVARVATEYVPRAMALPEDARVELTVGLGTARMSLRQVMGLAVGEVVPMGRPLAGPFEIRAAGTLIGQGELVDVDGELGVRIVSLAQE